MTRAPALGLALAGADSLWKKAALVLAGSLLVALAAQVRVDIGPVPLSLQTLAVLIVGFVLGSRLGAAALLAYLAEGFMGAPVFAKFGAGPAYFAGPTAGFLVGFVLMAWIAGLAADRGIRSFLPLALVGLFASAVLYVPGVLWPMALAGAFGVEAGWVGLPFERLWAGWVAPFLLGDALKAVLAALLVSGGWSVLRARGRA